jgi:hypothetical protein
MKGPIIRSPRLCFVYEYSCWGYRYGILSNHITSGLNNIKVASCGLRGATLSSLSATRSGTPSTGAAYLNLGVNSHGRKFGGGDSKYQEAIRTNPIMLKFISIWVHLSQAAAVTALRRPFKLSNCSPITARTLQPTLLEQKKYDSPASTLMRSDLAGRCISRRRKIKVRGH